MSEPIKLRAAVGSYLGAVHFYRCPDGTINAVLVDMPSHVIERDDTICKRFFRAADWCMHGASDLMQQGLRFDEEHRALKEIEP
jgi:hypothetical protein